MCLFVDAAGGCRAQAAVGGLPWACPPPSTLLQFYLYSKRLRITMATSITCCEGFRLKPQKVCTLRAFSLPLLFSPPQKSRLSRWACSSFIMAPLCAGSPLFLGFVRLSKCSCFWGQGPYQVIVSQLLRSAMKSPSSVAEHLGGVRPVTAGCALLCLGKALTAARKALVHFLCAKTFRVLGEKLC